MSQLTLPTIFFHMICVPGREPGGIARAQYFLATVGGEDDLAGEDLMQ